jgi:hypothetical protein
MAICIAVVAGIVTLVLVHRLIFRDLDDFQESLDVLTKDKASEILDDFGEDLLPGLKLVAWISSGLIVGLGVYFGLTKLLG